MKKYLLLLAFYSIFYSVLAQKEANIWYFGLNAGLDFYGGDPVAINDGELRTNEVCATY